MEEVCRAMSKKKYDEQLAAIEALRDAGPAQDTTAALRKALGLKNNYLVSKAAKIAGDLGLSELTPDLLKALDRFYKDAVKTDPQCWAKIALTGALVELGHREAAPFLRGLKHEQLEAVWGGRSDTAGPLRAQCALILVECRELDDVTLLEHLVGAMTDPESGVRVAAVRAARSVDLAHIGPLLRLRVLTIQETHDRPNALPDEDLLERDREVLGACFSALLDLEGKRGIPFVSRWLQGLAVPEAALALAETRVPEVVALLQEALRTAREDATISALMAALALTNLPEALAILLQKIEEDSADAGAAMEALRAARITEELLTAVELAVAASGNPRLQQRLTALKTE